MKTLMGIFIFVGFLFGGNVAFGWNEAPSFNKEDLLENLLEAPSLEESEEFKTLGYLNDEVLIEMKVDLTNHKRSVLTQVAETIVKYIPENPPEHLQEEILKMSKIVQRCADIEDNIWLIIKIRRLYEQKQKEGMLAEKPHKLQ
ncbi:MAG: hypothetical protein HUT38_03090 [Candidatus Paceibacter sp.]|nr:hypothetical protein [Candidatus Paceibacter sp.]